MFGPQTVPRYTRSAVGVTVRVCDTPSNVIVPVAPSYLPDPPVIAREMGMWEGALKVAVHRLRKRYRELFRQEIAETVAAPEEVEAKLRYLAAALMRT